MILTLPCSHWGYGKSVDLVNGSCCSGATFGPYIGHVTPEIILGGAIALTRHVDPILLDIPHRRLDINISLDEMKGGCQYRDLPHPRWSGVSWDVCKEYSIQRQKSFVACVRSQGFFPMNHPYAEKG